MSSRILIQNGTIITFGKSCQVFEDHALLIEGDRIARIAPKAEIQGPFDRVLDAKGKVVMPGLINAHMHFYSTLVRGLSKAAPSSNFQEVLENLWWRLDKKLSLRGTPTTAPRSCWWKPSRRAPRPSSTTTPAPGSRSWAPWTPSPRR